MNEQYIRTRYRNNSLTLWIFTFVTQNPRIQTLNKIFHKTKILNFGLSCQILLNSMDYFKLKCGDYKELKTLKKAQWWEKRLYVAFEKKKWWFGNFMMLIRKKSIKQRSEQKKSFLCRVRVKWMTMMPNERFDLVEKDELGIWNRGAEEEK